MSFPLILRLDGISDLDATGLGKGTVTQGFFMLMLRHG